MTRDWRAALVRAIRSQRSLRVGDHGSSWLRDRGHEFDAADHPGKATPASGPSAGPVRSAHPPRRPDAGRGLTQRPHQRSPGPGNNHGPLPCQQRPKVFVSYAWDSDDHKRAVKRLGDLLHAAGITVELDQKELDVRRDWNRWMTTAVLRSDYVVVVASPAYRAAGRYEHDDRTHAGVQAEYALLISLLYESRTTWVRKILPVVLPGREVNEIPAGFQPHDAHHYIVPELTPDGVAGLLRTIYHRWRPLT